MADIRINSLPTTASASSSDDFLALDGATNGTRKLNAYSPTFGGNVTASGNLTVSGVTTSAGISNSGALTFTAAIGQVAGSIAKNATYGLTYYGVTGSSNDNTMLNASGAVVLSNPAGTTNATLAGNLTVSGTGTTGGNLRVRNALGYATGIHTGTTSDSTQQLLLSSNAAYNHAYISKGSTTLGIGFSSDNGSFVADDSITITAATKLVTLTGNLTVSGRDLTLGSSESLIYFGTPSANYLYYNGSSLFLRVGSVDRITIPASTGNVLIGTTTDSANGKLQLATHTTSAGGIGFGTDTSLFRAASGNLGLYGTGTSSKITFSHSTTTAGKGFDVECDSAKDGYVWNRENRNIFFGTNNTLALTLDSSQNATFAGTVKIANTAEIKGVYTTTTTFDFGTIANNDASSVCTLTMTGVSSSDSIIVSPTDGDNFPQFCTVSAVPSGNTVAIRLYNGSGSSRTVGSRSIRVTAIKF